jgi:hypothetical protein
MVLLDFPDSEGVTRELAIGYRRRLSERKILFAVGVSAMLLLGAGVGIGRTVLRSSATGPASDIHLPVIPFPSASAGGSPSGIVRVHGKHPSPGAKAMRNIASAASPTPSAAGGELSVVFEAQGPEMTPQLCTFDDTVCQ